MSFPYREIHGFEDATRNFEVIAEAGMFVGTGPPAFVAKQGNYYFRTDTPTTVNQRIYVYTGTAWTGIL